MRRVSGAMRKSLLLFTFAAVLAVVATGIRAAGAQGAGAAAQSADTLRLSLNAAVARAATLGEEVRVAREASAAADAGITVARAAALPQLRLNATENRTVRSARGQAVGSIFSQPYSYAAGLTTSQTLFQGGRAASGMRAASAASRAAVSAVAGTRAQVALATQQAYLNALYTARIVAIQRASRDQAAARLAQTEQFERAGRASRYDVLRARVQVANLEPALLQAEGDAALALLELKRLANVPAAQPVLLTTVIDSTAIAAALATVDTTAGGAGRPAVQAARLTAEARRLGVAVARADLLPTVAFNLNTGYGAFPVNGAFYPPGSGRIDVIPCPAGSAPGRVCTRQNGGWFSDRSFGFTVSWPVFDGLRTRGAIDLAAAQARQAEAQLALAEEQAATDVAKSRADLARARAQYEARRQSIEEAREAFRLATLRYSRGLATQLEVTDAQIALSTAETNAVRSVYDLFLAVAALAEAQGRQLPAAAGE